MTTIYRLIARAPDAELVLYLPLCGDPRGAAGARLDDDVVEPHLARGITPDSTIWFGEIVVDDDDDGCIEAAIEWADWDDYRTDLSDLFAAPLRHKRQFRVRHLHAYDDERLFRVDRID